MAPSQGLTPAFSKPGEFERPFGGLARSSTAPVSNAKARVDTNHLAPEDAFYAASPPRRLSTYALNESRNGNGSSNDFGAIGRRHLHREGPSRSRSRPRRKRRWKKLLWVKQSYPDNYTDQATFLENLQLNPRLQQYEFWPLVADSTVIVQHVCSVIIFVVCFVGIFLERLSPVAVVGWGSFATFVGWLLWDWWVGQEDDDDGIDGPSRTNSHGSSRTYKEYRGRATSRPVSGVSGVSAPTPNTSTTSVSSTSNQPSAASSTTNLISGVTITLQGDKQSPKTAPSDAASSNGGSVGPTFLDKPVHSPSAISLQSSTSNAARSRNSLEDLTSSPPRRPSSPLQKGRASLRLSTIKSAVLIYFTLLGLSPILKSLTRSTSSDSIWAIAFWLLAINIFFCDYSGTWVGVTKFPIASLSTNAALMASTVLASRLPSTGQVFSLTLFSIEVFGLFPVFRRYARHQSWQYHVVLTVLLVLGAGGGVGMILDGGDGRWPWKGGVLGMAVGCLIAALAMGGCSWWLIGLQKYKNEIYGPWDPARPVIMSRRHWDHE
jgi:phosphatidylinositol N-acetylglucosaminyltransferase subunit C